MLQPLPQPHRSDDGRTRPTMMTTSWHLRGRDGSPPSCPGAPAALPTANPPDVDPPGPGAQGLPKQAAEKKAAGCSCSCSDLRSTTPPLGCTNVVMSNRHVAVIKITSYTGKLQKLLAYLYCSQHTFVLVCIRKLIN
jgi:hypothetical protein